MDKWSNASKTLILFMGLLSFLFGGCNRQNKPETHLAVKTEESKTLTAPPEIISEREEDFEDLIFYIQTYKKLADGSQRLHASGLKNGKPLALEIELGPKWKGGTLGDVIKTFQGIVTYHSVGVESDNFAQVLDELYRTKINPTKMATSTRFAGIALEGNPGDLASGRTKIKLFFESDVENEYAELFTNIDLRKHRLEIREKDPDYRSAVVNALTREN
jgi:hypothetical protein